MVRAGIGFDVHRFAPRRRLVLAGVEIRPRNGLLGHSDADVVCHAVADAILGAAALGDIGAHFPDSDPQWKDARSLDLLRRVVQLARRRGFRVVNVDCSIVAERPRLAPRMEAMRANIAVATRLTTGAVSIKATTSEKLGALGRCEGIAALAVAIVSRSQRRPRAGTVR